MKGTTKNNLLLMAALLGLVAALGVVKVVQSKLQAARREPIAMYLPSPYPYCDAVAVDARTFAKESGTGVRVAVGQENTQANVTANWMMSVEDAKLLDLAGEVAREVEGKK